MFREGLDAKNAFGCLFQVYGSYSGQTACMMLSRRNGPPRDAALRTSIRSIARKAATLSLLPCMCRYFFTCFIEDSPQNTKDCCPYPIELTHVKYVIIEEIAVLDLFVLHPPPHQNYCINNLLAIFSVMGQASLHHFYVLTPKISPPEFFHVCNVFEWGVSNIFCERV